MISNKVLSDKMAFVIYFLNRIFLRRSMGIEQMFYFSYKSEVNKIVVLMCQ